MKRLLSVFLSLVMILSSFSVLNITSFAGNALSYDEAIEYWRSEINKGTEVFSFTVNNIDGHEDGFYDLLFGLVISGKSYTFYKNNKVSMPDLESYSDYFDYSFSAKQGKNDVHGYLYTPTITMNYGREPEIKAEINRFAVASNIYSLSEYEKIKAIYDYLAANTSYDYTYSKRSVYDAIIGKSSVCEGYANAFKRLCMEFGLDCVKISGEAINNDPHNGPHAWNIVKLNGFYYNVDATWDSVMNPYYEYFLKNNDYFSKRHVRDSVYDNNSFNSVYPMAQESFNCKKTLNIEHNFQSSPYEDCDVCIVCSEKKESKENGIDNKKKAVASTKIIKLKGKQNSIKLSWKKANNVSGYQIQIATDRTFKKNRKSVIVKKQKTISTTIKKLKSKKKYYVRIRAYKNIKKNGKTVKSYSKWSSPKAVKTK